MQRDSRTANNNRLNKNIYGRNSTQSFTGCISEKYKTSKFIKIRSRNTNRCVS